jgi:hypothetical protein
VLEPREKGCRAVENDRGLQKRLEEALSDWEDTREGGSNRELMRALKNFDGALDDVEKELKKAGC